MAPELVVEPDDPSVLISTAVADWSPGETSRAVPTSVYPGPGAGFLAAAELARATGTSAVSETSRAKRRIGWLWHRVIATRASQPARTLCLAYDAGGSTSGAPNALNTSGSSTEPSSR